MGKTRGPHGRADARLRSVASDVDSHVMHLQCAVSRKHVVVPPFRIVLADPADGTTIICRLDEKGLDLNVYVAIGIIAPANFFPAFVPVQILEASCRNRQGASTAETEGCAPPTAGAVVDWAV